MFFFCSLKGNYFNYIWYRDEYNLPKNKTFLELLDYYETVGHILGHNPSLYFDTKFYRKKYKLDYSISPLTHFCQNSSLPGNSYLPNSKCEFYIPPHLTSLQNGFTNVLNEFIPLKSEKKRINILLPVFSLSAGPMTAYIIANNLKKLGYNVRLISMYSEFIKSHIIEKLHERIKDFDDSIEMDSLYSSDICLSYDDIFITTAWWTVYPLKFILGYMNFKKFFWLIQENELVIHSCGTDYAKALDCYNMDYVSIINTSLLFDDLKKINLGKFGNEQYCINECVCFEPSFNKDQFYFEEHTSEKIKIIFYSRGTNIAERNLYDLCVNVLKVAVINGFINCDDFEIISFGDDDTGDIDFGKSVVSKNLGFLSLEDYSKLMRSSDILISFQLAPHPSYPPLEMSHCNGVCLHTNFSSKNQESISRYTDKIIMSNPDILSLTFGLKKCIDIIKTKSLELQTDPKLFNTNWSIALDKSIERILSDFNDI